MESLLRRERLIVGGCLVAVVVLSWLYLLHLKAAMVMSGMDMPGMVMLDTQEWGAITLLLLFVMWAVMMVGMMTPAAAPVLVLFAAAQARRSERGASSMMPRFCFRYRSTTLPGVTGDPLRHSSMA